MAGGSDYDLFVIGGGSGGVRAARMAAEAGARVGLAEMDRFGGTCVIRGCVPKKLLVYAAHYAEDFEDAAAYGWHVPGPAFDWPTLIANKDREIARLEGIYESLLDKAGVAIHRGRARLVDAHTIEVAGERVTADTVLIATGGHPVKPAGLAGAEHGFVSDDAFHLERLPGHVVVVGGGYISVEFAGIFNALGARVTQLYRGPRVLRGFDEDIRATLGAELVKKGIDLRTETNPARIAKREDGRLAVELEDGGTIEADAVMFATGRRPNTQGLGLEAAGVELTEAGAVKVDATSRSTSAPNVYAVGDVTDRLQLTPVAIHEAMAVVDTLYRGHPRAMDHTNVPSAVFSQPPVGTVGLSEAAAREAGYTLDVYRASFRPMKHTLTGRDEATMMKLVVERDSQRVLGVHMVGEDAPEILQGMAVAVKAGASKPVFDSTVGIHPTAAEEFVTMRAPVAAPEREAAE